MRARSMVDGSDYRSLEPTLPGEGPTLDDAAHPRSGRDPAGAEGEVPDRIGRFVVVRRLGVGGMGAVFEAHDPALERPVALKLLRGDAHPGEHTRLRREAQALARRAIRLPMVPRPQKPIREATVRA